MANAPLPKGVVNDAGEGVGIVDRFALGEVVEEVFPPVLARASFGIAGIRLEFEGFSFGGVHGLSFLSRGIGRRFVCAVTQYEGIVGSGGAGIGGVIR